MIVVAGVAIALGRGPAWQLPEQPAALGASVPCAFAAPTADPLLYPVCDDQVSLLKAGIETAKRDGKLVLIELGATWCPECRSLRALLDQPEQLDDAANGFDFGKSFVRVPIGASALAGGRLSDVASGRMIADLILAKAPGAELRGWPFLAVIDPTDDSRVFVRNTGDLVFADGSAGHDPEKLRGVLESAARFLRDGVAPPAEPRRSTTSRLYHWLTD